MKGCWRIWDFCLRKSGSPKICAAPGCVREGTSTNCGSFFGAPFRNKSRTTVLSLFLEVLGIGCWACCCSCSSARNPSDPAANPHLLALKSCCPTGSGPCTRARLRNCRYLTQLGALDLGKPGIPSQSLELLHRRAKHTWHMRSNGLPTVMLYKKHRTSGF